MKYSLAKYIVTLKSQEAILRDIFGEGLSIGGQGSTTDSITVTQNTAPFSISNYDTGGYVFNASYDRHGSVEISVNQVSDVVSKMKQLLNKCYTHDFAPFVITVTDIEGNPVANCIDCVLDKPPQQSFGNEAGNQSWSFICGSVTFNS